MMQSDDESLRVDFDAILESSTKRPKLKLVKEEVENTTSNICWVNTLQSETTESIGCREDEYYSVHKEVSQDMIDSALMIQPKEEPPLLEFEAIIQNAEPEMKVEPSKKDIDDLSPHCLDTELTCPCDEPSSLEPHDGNSSPSSTALFDECEFTTMEAHAATFLDQHRILGIDLRTHKLKRLRHGIYHVDEYNGKEEEVPTSKDFLALPLLPESTSTRPGLVEQEYEEILEYLASNFRAFCGIDVESIDALMELNVKDRSSHLRKTLNSNLSRSSGINGSILDRNRLESDRPSHCQRGHYDRGNIYRFAALKVHPYYNQYLRVRVHAALSKSKEQEVREWLLGCSTQDLDKRLLLAPSLLREWGIPFEILVQHSHDSIYIHKEKHQLVNAGQCITERVPNRSITKPVNTNHHCKACGCNTHGRTVHVIDNPDSSMSVRAVSVKRYVHEATGHAATPSNLKCLVTHKNNHTHTAYSCSVCQKSFAKANSLRRHAKIHLPCEETREECPVCKKSILKTYMPVHRVTCRSTSLTCQHCKKTFARAGGLTLHISKCSQRT